MMKTVTLKNGRTAPFRRSRQRDRILELLQSTESHPTASWLYGKLRREFPDLSLGTVYRNIAVLIQQGLVSRIPFGSTFDRFEANMEPHYHFRCENCESISDLDIPVDPRIDGKLAGGGFRVRGHEIEFFGMCPKCAGKA
jgi:Fur family transcriptional regulator, peroxide stress response regulator